MSGNKRLGKIIEVLGQYKDESWVDLGCRSRWHGCLLETLFSAPVCQVSTWSSLRGGGGFERGEQGKWKKKGMADADVDVDTEWSGCRCRCSCGSSSGFQFSLRRSLLPLRCTVGRISLGRLRSSGTIDDCYRSYRSYHWSHLCHPGLLVRVHTTIIPDLSSKQARPYGHRRNQSSDNYSG